MTIGTMVTSSSLEGLNMCEPRVNMVKREGIRIVDMQLPMKEKLYELNSHHQNFVLYNLSKTKIIHSRSHIFKIGLISILPNWRDRDERTQSIGL